MTLNETLSDAATECSHPIEEEGGIILYNKEQDEYQFIKLTNQNKGTQMANVLWTADRYEYADLVMPMFAHGWRHYASFHTHPRFPALPSGIDLNVLFPGFPVNFIFGKLNDEISQWNVVDGNARYEQSYFLKDGVISTNGVMEDF